MAVEIPVTIPDELRIETARSVWLIRPDTYMRLPLDERLRQPQQSLNGALDDNQWHRHEGVWVTADNRGFYLRILPAGRPAGSYGITTGTIWKTRGQAFTGDGAATRRPGRR